MLIMTIDANTENGNNNHGTNQTTHSLSLVPTIHSHSQIIAYGYGLHLCCEGLVICSLRNVQSSIASEQLAHFINAYRKQQKKNNVKDDIFTKNNILDFYLHDSDC